MSSDESFTAVPNVILDALLVEMTTVKHQLDKVNPAAVTLRGAIDRATTSPVLGRAAPAALFVAEDIQGFLDVARPLHFTLRELVQSLEAIRLPVDRRDTMPAPKAEPSCVLDPELLDDIRWLNEAPLTEMERDTFGQLNADHVRSGMSIRRLRVTVLERIKRDALRGRS